MAEVGSFLSDTGLSICLIIILGYIVFDDTALERIKNNKKLKGTIRFLVIGYFLITIMEIMMVFFKNR